jgi:hypothetical protein
MEMGRMAMRSREADVDGGEAHKVVGLALKSRSSFGKPYIKNLAIPRVKEGGNEQEEAEGRLVPTVTKRREEGKN